MIKPTDPTRHLRALQSDVLENVLPAEEAVNFMEVHTSDYLPQEYALIAEEMPELQFRVCVCSVLEECSVLDTPKEPPRPVRVKACPVGERLFQH